MSTTISRAAVATLTACVLLASAGPVRASLPLTGVAGTLLAQSHGVPNPDELLDNYHGPERSSRRFDEPEPAVLGDWTLFLVFLTFGIIALLIVVRVVMAHIRQQERSAIFNRSIISAIRKGRRRGKPSVACSYCGSMYSNSEQRCPSCGAAPRDDQPEATDPAKRRPDRFPDASQWADKDGDGQPDLDGRL